MKHGKANGLVAEQRDLSGLKSGKNRVRYAD
jgi:hypothetical protein